MKGGNIIKNTSIVNYEDTICKELWNKGYRYRKNYKALPGQPDIAIIKYKVAIFYDSEFYHGKDWEIIKPDLENRKNSKFWIKKISENMQRDDDINKELRFLGWTVIRFWGKDITKNPKECLKIIDETIFDIKISEADSKN